MGVQPGLREVAAGLLQDERLLRACAARDMGAVFRLLNARGLSTRRIAAAVEIGQGRLYDYMNGKTRVEKLALFEQIADAFHIPGELLGLARRPWEPDATPEPPTSAQALSEADGDDLVTVDAFRRADRQAGGGRLYSAVVHHLSGKVAPRLVDVASSPQVFAAAAALTETAGWMAHDSGRDDLAARHFARALPLARAAGDLPLAAHVAASTSHLSLQAGDPVKAAHWAAVGIELARRGPRLPGLMARLNTMLARAMASSRQYGPAVQALDRAHAALAVGADDENPWLSPFDDATLAGESALALRDLGQSEQALRHGEQAVALREEGRTRSLTLSRIALARIHVDCGDLDAAVGVGTELLNTSPTLGSVRVVHQLDELGQLFRQYREYSPVRDYLARFDEACKARMLLLADIVSSSRGGSR
ncbi:helix-turn-helix transcriptional regulator [Kitasatospora sp. CM 4170]|uniref:XRE family transcriptional regulator n=1 Tax=Kitasatospora aburaviensis TaxID=67265 RepID=A0ABW1F1Z9_9ACTN|nr:helix-turn-helix transcriptional regulator [Kitasatospora sp. CM 4170]WNM47779.1 helix-turn-helix transcriptional regulator [Kitasatospora sp. CM 4170]